MIAVDESVEQIVDLFLWAFQPQWKFGRRAVTRQLQKVMREKQITPAKMLERIAAWGQRREDMAAWDMARVPPPISRASVLGENPVPRPAVVIGEVPELWLKRVRALIEPYEDGEV
jgi:hypothetical protein